MKKVTFSGKRVVVTGAASGIGLALVKQLSAENATLILVDINDEGLKKVSSEFRTTFPNLPIYTYCVDITKAEKVQEMAKQIVVELGSIDMLVNNAGVGFQGAISRMTLVDWQRLIDVNFWGTLYMTYAFLPLLTKAVDGQIINVSSGQAFFRLPTWGAYASVKLLVGALSEIWYFELKNKGIHMMTVYPYMVNTGFYDQTDTPGFFNEMSRKLLPYYSNTPEQVAKKIVMAAKKKKRTEMINVLNTFAKVGQFVGPVYSGYSRIVNTLLNRENEDDGPSIQQAVKDQLTLLGFKLSSFRPRTGFKMTETMQGEHRWVDAQQGNRPIQFEIEWGADQIISFLNPTSSTFCRAKAKGLIDVGGLCNKVPCSGTIHFDYFKSRSITYTLFFESEGIQYQLKGAKKNIRIQNLKHSHSLCTGQLIRLDDGSPVSDFIIHFFWEDLISFTTSFQLVAAD